MTIYQLDGECNIKEWIKDIEKSLEEERAYKKTNQSEKEQSKSKD
ncbi:hypothetical protein ABH521_000815 [Staphylococcus warneri]